MPTQFVDLGIFSREFRSSAGDTQMQCGRFLQGLDHPSLLNLVHVVLFSLLKAGRRSTKFQLCFSA